MKPKTYYNAKPSINVNNKIITGEKSKTVNGIIRHFLASLSDVERFSGDELFSQSSFIISKLVPWFE